jgi:hypothetical protein
MDENVKIIRMKWMRLGGCNYHQNIVHQVNFSWEEEGCPLICG